MYRNDLFKLTGRQCEFHPCAACDRTRWCYNLEPAPAAGTFKGRKIRKGAIVCMEHATLFNPDLRAKIARVRSTNV